jgi:GntR family transcriptional regulator, transcriptional repressor for pyruvate dehydrogenase complex
METGPDQVAHGAESALRPVGRRSSLSDAIAERLLSHIVQSGLHGGDRLPGERELARRLGVSRSSVREANAALQAQGVLEVRHGGGTFLRAFDATSPSYAALLDRRRRLPQVLEARRILEVPIAACAAERRTPDDVQAIDTALELMRQEVEEREIGVHGDFAFHRAITTAAHNPVLAHLMRSLADAIAETRSESLSQPGRPPRSLADHERIADAVRIGDAAAAREAMESHLDHVAHLRLFDWQPASTTDAP